MAKPDPNTIGEEWLKVSEARYDSMKHLLQSVKHDIDALTQKIDSTQKSPILHRSLSPRPLTSSGENSTTGIILSNSDTLETSFKPTDHTNSTQPDILANVNPSKEPGTNVEFPEVEEVEEYMDIRLRGERNPFSFSPTLIDCTIASSGSTASGNESIQAGENKTWRSPSDFNLRDPFEDDQLNQEFERQMTSCHVGGQLESHRHAHVKETDLDDPIPTPLDGGGESDGSLSPAVSPTFEMYGTESVQLKDMLLSNEETAALGLKSDGPLEKPLNSEDYQLYDNGHALTTIDEASEEVEDDWSSSELDSSLNSSDEKKDHMTVQQTCRSVAGSVASTNTRIDTSLKLAEGDSGMPHDAPLNTMSNDYSSRSATLKKEDDLSGENTFVFDSNVIRVADNNLKSVETVVLRAKKVDLDETGSEKHHQTQRPISMGSLRGSLKRSEKSPTGSLHSVVSSFSQESMISEADSYVTVCSRLVNTGSDDVYTTACSDSELPGSPERGLFSTLDDDCPTLSRKRTKMARGQRNRARERRNLSSSSSSSSIEEQQSTLPAECNSPVAGEEEQANETTIFQAPQPLVVTPKFSRLPSKLVSPDDAKTNQYPVNQVAIDPIVQIPDSQLPSQPGSETSGEMISHKRTSLQRPVRKSPRESQESFDLLRNRVQPVADPNNSDQSGTSESSSTGDEADYDASEPLIWTAYPMGMQSGTILPPNLVYKPCLQGQCDLTDIQRKRLSCIEEANFGNSGSSNNEDGESDSDDLLGSDSPRITDRPPDQSSDERQSDSGVVVIPKYTCQPLISECVPSTMTTTAGTVMVSENSWASTQAQSTNLSVESSNEPIDERRQHTRLNELTNPTLARRTMDQSEVSTDVVSVPPLAGRLPNKSVDSMPHRGVPQPEAHSDGDHELKTRLASSSNRVLSNELCGVEAEHKLANQTDMYANTNYYYPPEVRGSAHIYHDRVRAAAKPNVAAISTSQSSMRTNASEQEVLPLAAVLSSAEATAARPSIYSPLHGESDEHNDSYRSAGQFRMGPTPAPKPEGLHMRIVREDLMSKRNLSKPTNSSNDRPTYTCYPVRRPDQREPNESRMVDDKILLTHSSQRVFDKKPISGEVVVTESSSSWSSNMLIPSGTEYQSYAGSGPPSRSTAGTLDPEPDIQAASQRTSRIVHGNAEYVDASVRLVLGPQIPIPTQPQRSYILSPTSGNELEPGWRSTPERVELVSPLPEHTPIARFQDYSENTTQPDSFVERSITIPYGNFDIVSPSTQAVQLMHAPKHTSTPSDPKLTRGSKLRNTSPSPPRSGNLHPIIHKSPDVTKVQPKWQLRPIPTETEIRERLRSRSRQRAEERQSRAQRTDNSGTQAYRSRSSRSDSRYRCTDLDSAKAESRADTGDSGTVHTSVHGNKLLSEAKQSASLFDLDAQPTKFSSTSPCVHSATVSTKSERKFFGDAKSYNSLLETDIDTGENFERPFILETDVDRLDTRINSHGLQLSPGAEGLDNKTQSLFNLTFSHAPGQYRRQNVEDVHPSDKDTAIQHDVNTVENWQRTKSLQGIPHRTQEVTDSKGADAFRVSSHQSRANAVGAKGLIERLRDRAKSSHELRIAQSLTKLHVPDWLDKAECLNRSSIHESDPLKVISEIKSSDMISRTNIPPRSDSKSVCAQPLLSSTRSLSSSRKITDYSTTSKWLRKSPIVETVAEPIWPRGSGSSGTTGFIRPSQQFRERGDSLSRLKPIRSKLYSSMRSLATNRQLEETQSHEILRPQVAPRSNRTKPNGHFGQGQVFQLSPQDFMPRHEQLWGRNTDVLPRRYSRSNTEPHETIGPRMESVRTSYEKQDSKPYQPYDETHQAYLTRSEKPNCILNSPSPTVPTDDLINTRPVCVDDFKPVDYDSGTEQSSEHGQPGKHNGVRDKHSGTGGNNREHTTLIAPGSNGTSKVYIDREYESSQKISHLSPEENRCLSNIDSNRTSPHDTSEQSASDWRSIDAEGQSESEATDGLDQISDLTCLTNLIDTCATRHRALLANRPSALEHLLTSLGWWPLNPSVEHQQLPPTAAEAISIAAHEFDVDEDAHREEFLQLLQGPESRRPINLGEFALNHLSGAVQRKQQDGLLYISCGRAECMKSPIQVQQATDWCACANCYTLYCSPTCRALDRRTIHDHPTVCSFARAKRVCNRVLRNLAPGQITGLTALAKTGMARLGRGGILLPFALIRHAELFLKRAQSQSWNTVNFENSDTSLDRATACWEQHRQPSPGGLIAPPLYLTLQELQELDSTVANPCRTYVPSSSMVLIIVVCAYELIARSDGRPVHLFKQSLVLPFPAHNLSNGTRPWISDKAIPVAPEKPTVPQTNGLISRTDRQAAASREAYMIRLQRMLRERGVSLRHHHPEIYTQVANFVETGIPFSPIRISFHDFILREEVLCVIRPMHDPQIHSIRQMQLQGSGRSTEFYEEVNKERSARIGANYPASTSKRQPHSIVAQNISTNSQPRWQETNF